MEADSMAALEISGKMGLGKVKKAPALEEKTLGFNPNSVTYYWCDLNLLMNLNFCFLIYIMGVITNNVCKALSTIPGS